MDRNDRILQLVRMRGPILPSQVNKELDTNVLFASAMLSELVDRKVLRLSHAKIGGSPVYYLPGQEARLEMLHKYLHEKERRAFDLLKSKKVLPDSGQEPVIRVALREIKDFAFPLEVTLHGNTEIFWRWHSTSDKEAEDLIKRHLNLPSEEPEPEKQVEEQTAPPVAAPVAEARPQETIHKTAPPAPEVTPEPSPIPEPVPEPAREIRQETIPQPPQHIDEEQLDDEIEKVESEIEEGLSGLDEEPEKKKELKQEKRSNAKETQKDLNDSIERMPVVFPEGDDLFDTVHDYFNDNHIDIIDIDLIRKNSEIDFIIDLPTNIGSMKYFCKAKSKQKIGDGDLSSAYIQGQIKKMPILFITMGELTKKAKLLLDTEFKTMFVRKIG